jgi:Peptidase family M23
MRVLCLVVGLMLFVAVNAFALDQTSTGFYYPTGSSSLGSYAGWLDVPPIYFTGEYHLGKDIAASYGDPVYPIADGSVYYISNGGWSNTATTCGASSSQQCANNTNYCNVGVLVKHKLSDGTFFLALYAHVRTSVHVGDAVKAGVSFATVGHWACGDHLHFGIHPALSLPSHFGLGLLPDGFSGDKSTLQEYGFVDPISFITSHTPYSQPAPPAAAPPSISTELLSTQAPSVIDLLPGQQATFTVQFKNTGNTTWKGSGTSTSDANYIELETCASDGTTGSSESSWLCPGGSSWRSAYQVVTSTEATIPPSTTGTDQLADFSFTVQVPLTQTPGTYTQYFRLHDNNGGDLLTRDGGYDSYFVTINVLDAAQYQAFSGKFSTDGKWDVGIWDKVDGNFSIATANGSLNQFDDSGYWLTEWHPGAIGDYQLLVGDFSGDGYSDLCLYQPSTGNWYVAYNQGGYFQQSDGPGTGGAWLTGWGSGSGYIPLVGDFSGDGVADIALYYPSLGRWFVAYNQSSTNGGFQQHNGPATNNSWITGWATEDGNGYRPYAADVSGDGYADIIAYSPLYGRWFVAYNEGGYFQNASGPATNGSWLTSWATEDGSEWRCFVTDLSGDGYADLLAYSPTNGRWYVAYNQGGYFSNASGPDTYGSWLTGYDVEHDGYQWQILAADVSGDAYADLVAYSPAWGRWFVAYNEGGYFTGQSGTQTGGSWLDNWGKLGEGTPLGTGTTGYSRAQPAPGKEPTPVQFSLSLAPNPATTTTTIRFTLPTPDRASVSIHDVAGREVAEFAEKQYGVGQHSLSWNRTGSRGERVANGVYFITFRSTLHTVTRRAVILN